MPSSAGSNPAFRSAPEEKPRPAPVISTARTDSVGGVALEHRAQLEPELGRPRVQRIGPVQGQPPDAAGLLPDDGLIGQLDYSFRVAEARARSSFSGSVSRP